MIARLLLILACLACAPASAQGFRAPADLVRASLVAEPAAVDEPGADRWNGPMPTFLNFGFGTRPAS